MKTNLLETIFVCAAVYGGGAIIHAIIATSKIKTAIKDFYPFGKGK